jgi:hypothetical protein
VSPCDQHLFHNDTHLQNDDDTLAELGILPGSTLSLQLVDEVQTIT